MSERSGEAELDVRGMRKPDKHPTIFRTFAALGADESFVLVNDHDPKHLRDEFEADFAGSYDWEYLKQEPRDWRIRITKLTSAPLPRVLIDTNTLQEVDAPGAAWALGVRNRDLDSNVIVLPAGEGIDTRTSAPTSTC